MIKINIESEKNVTLEFAAEELRKYLEKIGFSGQTLNFYLGVSDDAFKLYGIDKNALEFDGFAIAAKDGKVVILSKMPRGVLFGVYHYLESLGCKFVTGGGLNELIRLEKNPHLEKNLIKNPGFEFRSIANIPGTVNDTWMSETIEIVDNCAKNKINSFFIHHSVDEQFSPFIVNVIKEIKKRGMRVEFGGHGVQNFLPREVFGVHPEYFIEKNGIRIPEGNFCTGSGKGFEYIFSGVKKILDAYEDIDFLHLWFDDVFGGSWCNCSKCKGMTPVQQQSYAADRILKYLQPYYPNVKTDILLYHDTLDNMEKLDYSQNNLLYYYAPRERCYSHSILDCCCKNNNEYAELLKKPVDKFGGAKIEIFEYYSDVILFSKSKIVIPGVIAQDLRDYKACGVSKICNLAFGKYSLLAYDLNSYVYNRHTFDPGLNVENTVGEYLSCFGCDTAALKKYYSALVKFSELYLSFCGYPHNRSDIRKLSLCGYFGKHLDKIKKAVAQLKKAQVLLSGVIAENKENPRLEAEMFVLEVTLLEVAGTYKRMAARWEKHKNNTADKSKFFEEIESVKANLKNIAGIINARGEYSGAQKERILVKHLCEDEMVTADRLINEP